MFFLVEAPKYRMLILFAISLIATFLVYKPIFRIATLKGIVDNPEARKIQKRPVPVLGGAAVFFGIIVGLGFFKTMYSYQSIFPVVMAMTIMLYVGLTDDILEIKPWKRLVIEAGVALLIIYGCRFCIMNFQGLWGVENLPAGIGVPLTVIAFVGITNAINLVDGVDGLCSGLCILACLCFGLVFFLAHDYSFCALAAVSAGALVPFFLHNMFGSRTKMFLGDGGSMIMGAMLSAMVIELLRKSFASGLISFTSMDIFPLRTFDFSLIAFSLAVLAIPIFDTLRVMFERIFAGNSPFAPDNRHLHHLLLKAGYSCLMITLVEICLTLLILCAGAASWIAGASVDVQFFTVLSASLLTDFGLAALLRYSVTHPESRVHSHIAARAGRSHLEDKEFWRSLERLIDGKSE